MTDTDALQLVELLGAYARAYGADLARDMTVRELADDLLGSLSAHQTGPSIDRARASLAQVFGAHGAMTRWTAQIVDSANTACGATLTIAGVDERVARRHARAFARMTGWTLADFYPANDQQPEGSNDV